MKTDSLEIQLLHSLIDTPKRQRKKTPKVRLADMTDTEFRAHKAKLQADSRKAIKEKKAQGSLHFNTATTRDALADAAIMLLASNAEGADAIRAYLSKVFPSMPGVPFTVTVRAKSGELKPKLLGFTKTLPAEARALGATSAR